MKAYKSDPNSVLNRFTGVYCGEALSGKTHCICTWPNTVVFCFDQDTQTLDHMPDVHVVLVESWAEFEEACLPYIRARAVGRLLKERMGLDEEPLVETIAVDTMSIASSKLANEIQGDRDRLRVQDFGTLLNKLTAATVQMTETAKELEEGQTTYNVLAATHLSPDTDSSGNVLSISPAIMGQFKKVLPRLFGFCFLTEHRVATKIINGNATQVENFVVRTVPPNDLYTCGDRIGGKGDYQRLPPVTGGTYPELMKAWGIKEEEENS